MSFSMTPQLPDLTSPLPKVLFIDIDGVLHDPAEVSGLSVGLELASRSLLRVGGRLPRPAGPIARQGGSWLASLNASLVPSSSVGLPLIA